MMKVSARLAGAAVSAALLSFAGCGPAPHAEAPPSVAPAAAGLALSDLRATPTPGGTTTSAGYLVIANRGAAEDRLLSAASPRAGRVELHSMEMDGVVMRMRKIDSIAIPAGGAVALEPGGMHVMFLEIATPFAEGETVPVTLIFEHAGAVEANLPVSRHEAMSGH